MTNKDLTAKSDGCSSLYGEERTLKNLLSIIPDVHKTFRGTLGWGIVAFLVEKERGSRELAKCLNRRAGKPDQASVCQAVALLEKKGLVEFRRFDPEDKRRRIFGATAKGREALCLARG